MFSEDESVTFPPLQFKNASFDGSSSRQLRAHLDPKQKYKHKIHKPIGTPSNSASTERSRAKGSTYEISD